jgi:hypothetical protein
MKWSTLQQHRKVVMLYKKGMIIIEVRSALLIPQNTKQAVSPKT